MIKSDMPTSGKPQSKRTARQRALVKLSIFSLCSLLFIMLACQMGSPPQQKFFVTAVEGPTGLFPNTTATYLFNANHLEVQGALANAPINIQALHVRVDQSHTADEIELAPQILTDEFGDFQLSVEMPSDASAGDILRLQFDYADEQHRGRTFIDIPAIPEVTIEHLNQDASWGAGPVTDMLVQVLDNRAQAPLPNVPWQLSLEDGPQGMLVAESGVTNEDGIARIQIDNRNAPIWDIPYQIGFTVETDRGEFRHTLRGLKGVEAFDVLLSTDKPVYQPGQTIHVRALTLLKTSLKAVSEKKIHLQLIAPNGTIISRAEMETSDYGIDSFDFPLDTQIASGDYTIRAETDFGIYNRTVEIKPYILPRFEIKVASSEPFYQPGSIATGTIEAAYFFGKPVANGTVRITATVPDAPGSPDKVELITLEGQTDENGRYEFTMEIPETLVAKEAHQAVTVDLDIIVIDSANHAEETDARITIAQQPLLFDAVAESGRLHPGVENIVYIQASTPDGRPAKVMLSVDDGDQIRTLETDQFGLASLPVYPALGQPLLPLEITVDAIDQSFTQIVDLAIEPAQQASLLLRPKQAEYAVGEPLEVDILLATEQDGFREGELVMIEVKKQGYLYNAEAVAVFNGRATATIPVDPSLIGTVELTARVIGRGASVTDSSAYPAPSRSGEAAGSTTAGATAVSDTRLVLINPSPMQVELQTDADQYRPGETATLDLQLTHDGQPVQGMLGISIVDESVFALGSQDPAFARTYFLIDKELTQPHYGIEGFAPFGGEPSPYVGSNRVALAEHESTPLAALVPPSSLERLGEGLLHSQQTALFGALAQELQWTESANAAAPTPIQSGQSHSTNTALPVGLFLTCVAVAATRRNRKQTFVSIGIIVLSTIIWTACASPAGAPAEDGGGDAAAVQIPEPNFDDDASAESGEAFRETGGSVVNEQSAVKPRLRQFFPETLVWLPEVETDENGQAAVDLEIADSITTWRVSVIASDKAGNLGSAQLPMRVFQDFFVEPSLPLYLTEDDEISVPVSLFNYLDEAQTITLDVEPADWFELREVAELSATVAPNEVASLYIPIRVLEAGRGEFLLTATGSSMSDAVLRQVNVAVNGQYQEEVINGRLTQSATHELTIDERALADESTITVRFYPGPLSEMVSGLEAMLRQPNGCFEQTSGTNYPNVMILDYLRTTGQNVPRIEEQATNLVERGYQRLLSFEVPNEPGAFSLYGQPPSQLMLTAYGLMQFSDQSRVTHVDPALLDRIVSYISQQQNEDGSWTPTDHFVHRDLSTNDRTEVVTTAFITWALAESGQSNDSIWGGIEYLKRAIENQSIETNYAAAMALNAFLAAGVDGPEVDALTTWLVDAAKTTETDALTWNADQSTYMGGYAEAAHIETSAMVAIALLKSGQHLDVAVRAIQGLQDARGNRGYYHSTQATVLVLKALTLSEQWRDQDVLGRVTVTLNGQDSQSFDTSLISKERPVELTFDSAALGANDVTITVDGELSLAYQIAAESYLPWDAVVEDASGEERPAAADEPTVDIAVSYAATEVALNEKVLAEVQMTLDATEPVANIMAEVGLPPGFRPATADLDQLVGQTVVADYEIRRDKLVLYLSHMEPEQSYRFGYNLTPAIPGVVQAPPSFGYPYYASNLRTIDAPQILNVTQ